MKSVIISFFCVLPLLLAGQDNFQYAALLIPAELRENANAVIRRQEMEFYVKSPGEAVLRETRAVTLFNDKSYYDHLLLHYDNLNKIGKIRGKVFDGMGRLIREIDKKEINDQSAISDNSLYEDSRLRFVDIDNKEYPYTVEFEYEMTYRDLRGYPDWSVNEFAVAVEQAVFTLDLPAGFGVQTRMLNFETTPSEETVKDRRRLTWTMKDLPAVKREPYGPPPAELLPKLVVSPEIFEARKYTGSMASWQQFGNFMNQLMAGRDELSPAMKNTVKDLTANAAGDQEKIEILYRYLQQNYRYVSIQIGIGGWQPYDAKYVEEKKYGDCKALSNFMKAMLKEAGVKSYPVLIFAGDLIYEVTEDFVNPAFNHMILYVPSEDCWLECTSNTAPPDYLGSWTADRNVLLVTENGGEIARTPALPPSANFEGNEVNIQLEADGRASVKVNSTLQGGSQEWHREAAQVLSQEELRKAFQKSVSIPSFTYEKLAVAPAAEKAETSVLFEAQVPRYASKAGSRLFVPFNAFNQFSDIPPANDNRRYPVVVRDGFTEEDRITISLPTGYRVESMPGEDFLLESPYGKYSLRATASEGVISIERRLEIRPCRLPAEEYGQWRDFQKEIAKADGAKLVLVNKS